MDRLARPGCCVTNSGTDGAAWRPASHVQRPTPDGTAATGVTAMEQHDILATPAIQASFCGGNVNAYGTWWH